MSKFTSFLSPLIESFIEYRKKSEKWNDNYEQMLKLFDRYLAKTHPDSEILSQEMVDGWCKQIDSEKNNSCRSRTFVVVSMIRYLRIREKTDVNEPVLPRKERRTYIPHAFTEPELANFFNACDNLPSTPNRTETFSRKMTIPVLFRLLYSSGIRTNEARLLRVADVDLQNGILNIQYSKGHDQHYAVLHDSMLSLMRQYDEAIKEVHPNRTYFFPGINGRYCTRNWLCWNFNKLWNKENKSHATPYALRHHYATSNINGWADEGFGFDDKLLYLSKSMGHRDIESTKYYYSLVPGLADILEEKTNADFEDIVPEVKYEEVE